MTEDSGEDVTATESVRPRGLTKFNLWLQCHWFRCQSECWKKPLRRATDG